MNANRLEEKDPGETIRLEWDFSDKLGDATIEGDPEVVVEADASLFRRTDGNANSLLVGDPFVVGKVVCQVVHAGVDGVDYKFTAKAPTSDSPALLLFMSSVLPVRAQ